MEFKKYAILHYDSLYESFDINLIETDIERGTEDFNALIDSFDTNHGHTMVMNGDKFLDIIKMFDLTQPFTRLTKEHLED